MQAWGRGGALLWQAVGVCRRRRSAAGGCAGWLAIRILALSQGVGFKGTYTEIEGRIQTTHHPPDSCD
eukprot:COSAG01_NODE_74118_length_227_cov_19.492188_1_plen_67_part_10